MSSRSSRTSYSKVSSVEIDFVSRSGSTRRGSQPRAKSRTRSPHAPKSSRRRTSSSSARSPIVSIPNAFKRRCVFGPMPHSRPAGNGARKSASPPGAIASRPFGLHASDAIFATIFAAATPALTVSPVPDATSRRISAASSRASSNPAPSPTSTKASSSERPSTAWPRAPKIAKISRDTVRYFAISGATTTSCGQAARAL